MKKSAQNDRPKLSDYEAEQVRHIAAWKAAAPNPYAEMFKRLTVPGARLVERVIPDSVFRAAIEKSYEVSEVLAGRDEIRRQAGVHDLDELRHKPLENCDKLAIRVGAGAQAITLGEGVITGAGGVLTTLIDIPLLFVLGVRTILKIGHCYGYPLDRLRDRFFVLGVLLAATSGSLATRRERLHKLREIEDMLLEEAQEDMVTEELASFLFQLEVFADIPGIGAISGALLNLGFIRRIDVTARRVFQERWLRDNGKVDHIEPAEVHARHLITGWTGALGRATYSTTYYLSFGATMPVWFAAALLKPLDNAMTRGARDGAAAAAADVDRFVERTSRAAVEQPGVQVPA